MGSKNTFSRALKHLKSTQIDEGMPTNNTQGLMTVGDPSRYIPPEGEVVEYLDFDKDNDDDDGKNTDGIFLSDGTILTVEPPGDTSYVLGPMSSMWYAWGNFTRIGYIRQSDRKMVNLGSITGELGDWDGSSNFTSYGQLTLEQAVWFKNIEKKDGGGNDDPNYRAFYPGPPSNTPDAFGRYLCVITGKPKDFGYERKGYTTKPEQGASSPEDNFSAQDGRDKGDKKDGIRDFIDNIFGPGTSDGIKDLIDGLTDTATGIGDFIDGITDTLGDNIVGPLGDALGSLTGGTGTGTSGTGTGTSGTGTGRGDSGGTGTGGAGGAGGAGASDKIPVYNDKNEIVGWKDNPDKYKPQQPETKKDTTDWEYINRLQQKAPWEYTPAEKQALDAAGQSDFYKGGQTSSPLGDLALLGATAGLVKGALAAGLTGLGLGMKSAATAVLGSQLSSLTGDAKNSGDYNKQLATKLTTSIISGKPQEIKLSSAAKKDQINNLNPQAVSDIITIGGNAHKPSAETTVNPTQGTKGSLFGDSGWGTQGGSEIHYNPKTDTLTITSEKTLRTGQEGDKFDITKGGNLSGDQVVDRGKQTAFGDIPSPSPEKVEKITSNLLKNVAVDATLGGMGNVFNVTTGNIGDKNPWDQIKNDPQQLEKFEKNLASTANDIATGAVQGTASNAVDLRKALTDLGVPQSDVEKIGGAFGQVSSQTNYSGDQIPASIRAVINSKTKKESFSFGRLRKVKFVIETASAAPTSTTSTPTSTTTDTSTSTASSSSDLKPIADNIAGEIVDKKGVEVAKKVEDGLKDYADENDIPSEDESTEGVYDDQIAGIEGKLETLRQELEDIINQDDSSPYDPHVSGQIRKMDPKNSIDVLQVIGKTNKFGPYGRKSIGSHSKVFLAPNTGYRWAYDGNWGQGTKRGHRIWLDWLGITTFPAVRNPDGSDPFDYRNNGRDPGEGLDSNDNDSRDADKERLEKEIASYEKRLEDLENLKGRGMGKDDGELSDTDYVSAGTATAERRKKRGLQYPDGIEQGAPHDPVGDLLLLGLSYGAVKLLMPLVAAGGAAVLAKMKGMLKGFASLGKAQQAAKTKEILASMAKGKAPEPKPWTSSSYNPNKPGGGPARKRFPVGDSYEPQGRVITESSFTPRQRKILREIRTPYKMPEIPTKFKVKPKGRVVGGGLMKSESVPPQFKSTSDNRMWRKYEYKENIRASQEKKNQVLELIGEGDHQWNYMLNNERWRTSQQMKKFYGDHDYLYDYYYGCLLYTSPSPRDS